MEDNEFVNADNIDVFEERMQEKEKDRRRRGAKKEKQQRKFTNHIKGLSPFEER